MIGLCMTTSVVAGLTGGMHRCTGLFFISNRNIKYKAIKGPVCINPRDLKKCLCSLCTCALSLKAL